MGLDGAARRLAADPGLGGPVAGEPEITSTGPAKSLIRNWSDPEGSRPGRFNLYPFSKLLVTELYIYLKTKTKKLSNSLTNSLSAFTPRMSHFTSSSVTRSLPDYTDPAFLS